MYCVAYPPRELIERKAEVPMHPVGMISLVLLDLHTHTEAVQAKMEAGTHRALDPN